MDVALLTVAPHTGLSVLLIKREGRHLHDAWQLPGTFLHEGETLADAAARALRVKVGVDGFDPLQLEVLDAPGRDDRGWVLSVAHLDVVPFDRLDVLIRDGIRLEPVRAVQGLAFDHDRIVDLAVGQLRREYAHVPDPRRLLGEEFTLLELQRLHEAVAGEALPKDTFRRSMQAQLTDLGRTQPGVVGKPARLFGRR